MVQCPWHFVLLLLLDLKHLRQVGVVGKFVEFFGPGVAQLSIADRATIANMCPEYGATAAFFPVDDISVKYLEQTGECPVVWTRVLLFLETFKIANLTQQKIVRDFQQLLLFKLCKFEARDIGHFSSFIKSDDSVLF